MSKLKTILGQGRIRFSLPLLPFFSSYEVVLNDVLDSQSVDERIAKLDSVKEDLESAIKAVTKLQADAQTHKQEATELERAVKQLEADKDAAEKLLKIPQESVLRLVGRATLRGRVRGWIEGAVIGLITGCVSSYLVWSFTAGPGKFGAPVIGQ